MYISIYVGIKKKSAACGQETAQEKAGAPDGGPGLLLISSAGRVCILFKIRADVCSFFSLPVPQLPVLSVPAEELIVRAFFNDPSLLHHVNAVAVLYR